jgi:hypothetical protein
VSHSGASGAERRRHPRLDHHVPVKISSEDADIVTETLNLSCSGAFCRINRRLEPMTKLKIHLLLPIRRNNKLETKKISCLGVVVRAQSVPDKDYFDTAIFFSDINPKDSQLIGEFVENLLEERNDGKLN